MTVAAPPLPGDAPALAAPLAGVQLVEASAGTGKTWTIAALYLRLVLERGLRCDQILVVTFTEAATAELRERIRARLTDAAGAFAAGASDDPLLAALLARTPDAVLAGARLRTALRGFDEAAIHTIHGYAGRVLADSAFEAGLPFDAELVADDGDLVEEIAADFLRRHCTALAPLAAARAEALGLTLDGLTTLGRGAGANPRMPLLAPASALEPAAAAAALEAAAAATMAQWPQVRTRVEDLLARHPGLGHRSYSGRNVPAWCAEFTAAVDSGDALTLATWQKLHRFTTAAVLDQANGKAPVPVEPFFDLCTGVLDALAALDAALRALVARFVTELRAELPLRKRGARRRSYDDLLLGLREALEGPGGARLAALLRERYPAALIDEFQDTDPQQYAIFAGLYGAGEGTLFMVGDAKQAIYSFRGADVYAYLEGQRAAHGRHALRENRRSDAPLVDVFNALFDFPGAFALDAIGYPPAVAAPPPREGLVIDGDDPAPCVLWRLPAPEGGTWDRGEARELVAQATAGEVARLLALAAAGRARLDGRPLAGGDIAILVRTYHQGTLVREALRALGVPAVEIGRRSVLDSPVARELDVVLAALAQPRHEGRVRAALGTSLVGLDAAGVAALAGDDAGWQRWLERFGRWHALWREHGFMRMFGTLAGALDVPARLLARPDGERRLTDLRHLAEILQTQAAQSRAGVEALRDWYARRLADTGDREREDEQLRLESDADLVRIVTIHRSKGLQFPIVLCPWLWETPKAPKDDEAFVWHDPDDGHRPRFDLRIADRDAALAARRHEAHAESLRLFYVAVTRACHRLVLAWGRVRDASASAAAWFLFGRGHALAADPVAAVAAACDGMSDAEEEAALAALAARAGGALRVEPLPAAERAVNAAPAPVASPGPARAVRVPPPAPWRIASYSSLVVSAAEAAPILAEGPDHDALARMASDAAALAPPEARTIHAFPRGARAGTCLHALFERIDFAAPAAALEPLAAAVLEEHGYARDWAAVVAGQAARVLATPLGDGGPVLAAVDAAHRLPELEFHLPLAGLDAGALRRLLDAAPPPFPPAFARAARRLDFGAVRGLLKGYVDLVFAAGGRWYVADWKSNWLGPDAGHYGHERLVAAMAHEHYYLQYLLYLVALHRYLRRRLPGYDYDAHVGGACYLFLRGMDPATGAGTGVFLDRPDRALVEGLDRLLAGTPSSRAPGGFA